MTPSAQQAPGPDPSDSVSVLDQLAGAPAFTMSNGLVNAAVLLPDPKSGFYRGTRFDWSGQISRLTVGKQVIYQPWFDQTAPNIRDYVFFKDEVVAGPNTAALGPVDAYDPVDPPGWAEAAAGESFLKIGVGLLRKPDDGAPYSSFRTYAIIDGGVWRVRTAPLKVVFEHVVSANPGGYGYRYRKILRLDSRKPQLLIEHRLTNTGSKAFRTTSFNHNFLTLDGDPTGGGLALTAPFDLAAGRPLRDVAEVAVDRLTFRRPLSGTEVFSTPITGFAQTAASYDLGLTNAAGKGFRVRSDRPISSLLLWSIRRTVAIEPFIKIDLPPGKTEDWSFTYTYSAGD